MKITVNCLIKNEERFVWFALNSVLDWVDEILVWDTGSTDKTIEIVKLIDNPKVKFQKKGLQTRKELVALRQQMLKMSDCDWVMILDGDEVWGRKAIEDCKHKVLNAKADVVVSPVKMLVGDIFHYQEERAGQYSIAGKLGHYNIRFLRRNIPGLCLVGIYPNEAYVDNRGTKVQDFSNERILFLDEPYLHASYLRNQSYKTSGIKYELGQSFPFDYYYPEVFFKPRPAVIPSPWIKTPTSYFLHALAVTPFKKIKRRFI